MTIEEDKIRLSLLINRLYYIEHKDEVNANRKKYKRQAWEDRKDKETDKARRQTPEYKAKDKARRQTPEYKAKKKEWDKRYRSSIKEKAKNMEKKE
jgi:hypothetical protein